GREDDLAVGEVALRAADSAVAAAAPERAAVGAAHAKRHQRAAVVEGHADPVPADRARVHVGVAAFVIEPGPAGDRGRSAFDRERAANVELRLAVVAAELLAPRALARDAVLALQQKRLRRRELEVEGEAGAVARGTRRIATGARAAAAQQAPVAQGERGVGDRRLGDAEAAAGDALVVPQSPCREVADGAVREQQLAGREPARVGAGDVGGGAEERDLETP